MAKTSVNVEALIEMIGEEPARILINTFSGSTIYIPKMSSLTTLDRNKKILERFITERKKSENNKIEIIDMLAKEFKLSTRMIWRIIGNRI
jgi:Mor family transcriptional regulator